MRVLVTGGLGFIGTHLVPALLARGDQVTVLDGLDPQVHGPAAPDPARDTRGIRILRGDVADPPTVRESLGGAHAVVHLAAAVGVGQSMYEIERYVRTNDLGTACLLGALTRDGPRVTRLVVASSMSLYGEGAYTCRECGPVRVGVRPVAQLEARRFEPECPRCRRPLAPAPTTEDLLPRPTSVYAVTKHTQEDLVLTVGQAYGIPAVALRLFNVYGPGQSLSNPYTGVAAIFSSRMLCGQPPLVFEDGLQSRDFIDVRDIVRAILLALESPGAVGQVLNVGTGIPSSVLDLARGLARHLGYGGAPSVLGRFRAGDIRHCYAGIERIRSLGFTPQVALADGLGDLASWVRAQTAIDRVDQAVGELDRHRLIL